MDTREWALKNTLVLANAGSRLYGTHNENSDYDLRGVCLDPPWVILGLGGQGFKQLDIKIGKYDVVIYPIAKFLGMCKKANPTILDILYAPPDEWIRSDPEWEEIYSNREVFLTNRVIDTYTGYAYSQLKRIKRHKVWIDNPPAEPVLADYGLELATSRLGVQSLEPIPSRYALSEWRKIARDASFHRRPDKGSMILEYKKDRRGWENYKRWIANRNPARAELERLHGYDTKHASHLVRLMLQVRQILQFGDYDPRMDEATRARVLSVLRGEWDYDHLVAWAAAEEKHIRSMRTVLRNKPRYKVINRMQTRMHIRSMMQWRPFIDEVGRMAGEELDKTDDIRKDS